MTSEQWADRAAKIKAELDGDNARGPDEYFQLKDAYWHALAMSKKTTSAKLNPMNFWHGGMSN